LRTDPKHATVSGMQKLIISNNKVLDMIPKQKKIFATIAFLAISLTIVMTLVIITSSEPRPLNSTTAEQASPTKPMSESVGQRIVQTDQPQPTTNLRYSNEVKYYVYTILVFLTLSLLASTYLILYLLNWRYKISDTQVSVVPQNLMEILSGQTKALNSYSSHMNNYIQKVSQDREKTDADIVELQRAFAIFQESLNKKDLEIERYKKGYDSAVYEKFLRKFIKFYIEMKKESDAPENQQSAALLKDMLEILEDALLECNVEIIAPVLMKQAEEYHGIIGGNQKTRTTDQQDLHGKIAEVSFPAFLLITQAGEEVLREASITTYVYKESETT